MHSKNMMSLALIHFVSLLRLTTAHTWVEQLTVIAPNGTMVGQPGFPRNFVQRTPTFSDSQMVFLIPPNGGEINKIDVNQMMCRPEQTTQTQSSDSPRLQASPGQSVALRYQENGHVTLPQNQPGKPKGSGANFVYYTTNSKPNDQFLQIHRQWTADGKGGDGRGRLLSTQNFDDGQCYQINGGQISTQRQAQFKHEADPDQGAALWCQQDIQIPADAQPNSTITLYWVWDWPTMPGTPGFPEGKQELYTTCMDIDIVQPVGQSKAATQKFVKQDVGRAAVASQFADVANPTAITAQTIPFSGVAAASSAEAASSTNTASEAGPTSPSATQVTTTSAGPSTTLIPTPNQVTVTVQETVTATAFETATLSAQPSIPVVTATETDFVTVTRSRTMQSKHTASVNAVVSEPTPCSKTASAYQLRARRPFYILPSQDLPSSVAGNGC